MVPVRVACDDVFDLGGVVVQREGVLGGGAGAGLGLEDFVLDADDAWGVEG